MKLGSIQLLRAVAALLVVYCHSIDLQMAWSRSFQQNLFHLQDFGAFGVDIFFVISGFIISYSAEKYTGISQGFIFLWHRCKRIFPAYYAATLLLVLVQACQHALLHSPWWPYDSFVKSIVMLPLFDQDTWISHLLYQAWTLSFEWVFYLLFFCTIITGVRDKQRLLYILTGTLLVIGSVLGLLFHWTDFRLQFYSNPILLEFIMGVALYRAYRVFTLSARMAGLLLGIGIVACLVEIVAGYGRISEMEATLDNSWAVIRFVFWGFPALALVSGCVFLEKAGRLRFTRTSRLVVLLGNASYSLYLTNGITYAVLNTYYAVEGFHLQGDLAIFLQVLIAVTIGVLFYLFVESPLLKQAGKSPYSISTR